MADAIRSGQDSHRFVRTKYQGSTLNRLKAHRSNIDGGLKQQKAGESWV